MGSKKGEILVLVSSPSFNPNYFIQGSKKVKRILKSKFSPMINRAIQLRYALGSTFKPIVAIAGLEEKIINSSTTFFCSGEMKLGERLFRCWDIHQEEDVLDALAHSCNIYFYHLGLKLGVERIIKWAKKFGLDSFTEIDLPYEKKGFIPHPSWKRRKLRQHWYKGDTLNLSIGQGFIEITPLEILLAINVFANGGYLIRPYLLKKIEDLESEISSKSFIGISKKNLEIVKKGLIYVVQKQDGTAHILKRLNLKIAGKTGTAQTQGKPHGWFVGFFPYDNPKYTFCVFLENAGSSFEALKVGYYFLKRLKEEGLI
jgi:penicillin-binding protein 2